MHKRILLSFLVFILIFFRFFTVASAQVVINEFSSFTSADWVEVYNFGTETVNLSGYLIRDSTETNKIDLDGNIESGGFLSFGFSNRLNKDGDTVKLLKINGVNEDLIDSIPYGGDGQVCSPINETESIGRVPDGGNTIDRFKVSTRDSSNNSAELNSCPTPTPLPTNSPTPTPKPTSTTKPVSTQKPTATNSPTPTPKPMSILTPTTKPLITREITQPESSIADTSNPTNGIVAGVQVESDTNNSNENGASTASQSKKFPIAAAVLMIAGVSLLGISLLPVIRNYKKRYN
jgi:hypothetical protein